MKKLLPFLLLTASLMAQHYKQLPCGLYEGSNGSLAYKSQEAVDDVNEKPRIIYKESFTPTEFTETTYHETPLKEVIDTASFQFVNYCFWKDKNHIYTFSPNSSGGNLYIAGYGDPATLVAIGNTGYAKDKEGVYHYSYGKLEGADPNSFEVIDNFENNYVYSLGKDKRYYYSYNQRLDMDKIKEYGLTDFLQSLNPKIPLGWFTEKPEFKNQGEQEDYWAYKLFREQYERQEYPKYQGAPIKFIGNVIEYGSAISQVNYTTPALRTIFTSGLFYPQLIGYTNVKANNLQELDFLSTPQVKRYRFWLSRDGFMNPQVYLFELQNPNATENTATEDFIKGAKLTFVKEGWIII